MKSRFSAVLILGLLGAVAAPGIALADVCNPGCWWEWMTVGTVMFPFELSVGATASTFQQKQAFVAQVKDDAAEFLAEGGAPSAILGEAIREVRERIPASQGASDETIARFLLNPEVGAE